MVNGKKKCDDSPASLAGDSSALRRSTRSQNNSSLSVRKSHRLKGRSPLATPLLKKKTENPSPLHRSGKVNKSQSSAPKGMAEMGSPSSKGSRQQSNKGGSSMLGSSKNKEEKQGQNSTEIAQEVDGQGKKNFNSDGGSKRMKRLDARRYREMFKPLKMIKTSDLVESETGKNRRLECFDANGDSDFEKALDGQDKHSDVEELKGDDEETIFNDAGGSNSVVNGKTCPNKPRELEDGENNLASPSPRKEVVENSDKTEEMPAIGFVMEKLPNGVMLSGLDKLSHDSNDLGCSQKGLTSGASTIENEGTGTCLLDAHSVLSLCNADFFSKECSKCFRKQSLDRASPEQVLCCCLSNTVNDVDGSKDRGICGTSTAEFADEHGQNVKQSNSSLDVCGSLCGACQCAGKLLHCGGKGCKRSYHPLCSLNPEKDIYLPNWFCSECTKKRYAFGVHSVSQGVESVFDVRDVAQSTEGRLKQKQCFVKYKGLAHIHNRWLPLIQLLHEVPELHANIGRLNEETQWNPIWSVPHRLLSRRSVIIDDTDQGVRLDPKSQREWLVKWCGLDFDQATWESEDSSCFKTPEAQQLIKEYETRHYTARTAPLPIQEKRKGPHVKLGKHSVGGADNCYENFVNKLRDWYHKGQNAILLNEQDSYMKTIYLVSSLVAGVSRPFLIIVPHASLSSWETEFMCLASSINVVVYGGSVDARDIIRSVEFFEGGQVMVQVLLSSAEVIAEDTEELKGIEWEAVIIDDCQHSCVVAHSGAIMNLATRWRLLLVNAQLEDNISEYINILSLVEPDCRNLNEENNVLKDKLSSFIICAKFIEYWVPVEMSNLQLEQYCYSILSKSSVLQSISKSDPVGSLRDILISLRKCCDHPYIVDMHLQNSLTNGLPYDAVMDLGIKASGKLHLLDKLLSELKNQGLKVLILFQPAGGSGRDNTGNILDDFLRFRFDSDSYEHVESGLVLSKKQNACNQFNNVKERSFLLLETRACSPSIKLSLVDAVIIFDSDWNPLNDLRALQKITVDSKIELIKVFRLYCPCTVEEKVLILAKNDVITLQSTSPSTSHMLLMWGSSYLFSRLHKFHRNNVSDCKNNIVFRSSLSKDVTQEIVSLFQNRKLSISGKNISLAQQNGGCYLKSIPVIGEQRILDDGVSPHVYWTNLLEGLKPRWKYLSGSSQRNRKRVQYNESSEIRRDEATKRRKKTDNTKIDSSPLQAEPRLETSVFNSTGDLLPGNTQKGFEKYRKKVEKECDKQMEKLKVKHHEELKKFEKSWEDERMKLEHWCKVESAVIRVTHANSSVGTDKLRALDNDYARKREGLERKLLSCFKDLEARQQIEREDEQKKIAGFMERIKSLGHASHAKNGVYSNVTDPIGAGKESNESMCNNGNLLEKQYSEREASRTHEAPLDSIATEKLENTDKQRPSCENDDSINASENIAVSIGAGIITCAPEQPCASTGQAEKDTNPVNAVVEDTPTSLPSNQINEGCTSSTKQLIIDTSQALGAESHIRVEGLVLNATGINNSSTLDESSPLHSSKHVSSNIPRTGEMNIATECSLDKWNSVAPISRLDNQPNENHASIGGSATPMHHGYASSSSSSVAFSQHHPLLTVDQSVNTNHVPVGVISAHASLPSQLQARFTSNSRVPTSLPDPLQLEFERLRSEMTKVMNHHEGTKLQLKTECDKEIEEVVAQVQKRYEKKLDEAEASFALKRNELEMCQHKVMMNKVLAEAFRSKCTDCKAAPKMQQGIPFSSSSVEGSSRSDNSRPFPVTAPLTTTPITSTLNTAPPIQGASPTMSLVTQSRMACTNPGVVQMAGQQQQVWREAHAPDSPIQGFSSSIAISSSSVPMVALQNNPMSTPALHLPPQAPQLPTSAQPNPHGWSDQEDSLGRGTLLSHLSNTELLRNDASLLQNSSNVPLFPDNVPSSESWDISQFEEATNPQPLSSSLPTGDVVCFI